MPTNCNTQIKSNSKILQGNLGKVQAKRCSFASLSTNQKITSILRFHEFLSDKEFRSQEISEIRNLFFDRF